MFKLIAALFAWSEAKDQDWRSWLLHTALALVITAVGGLAGSVWVGGAIALAIYGWRELEQLAAYKRAGLKIPAFDCLMDYWAPHQTVCALVSAWLGFWWIALGCLGIIAGGLVALYRYKRFTRR